MRPILGLEFLLTSLLFVPLLIFNDKNTSASTVEEDSGNFMMVETPEHDRIPDLLLVEKPDGKTSLIQIDADKGNDTIIDRSIGNYEMRPLKRLCVYKTPSRFIIFQYPFLINVLKEIFLLKHKILGFVPNASKIRNTRNTSRYNALISTNI